MALICLANWLSHWTVTSSGPRMMLFFTNDKYAVMPSTLLCHELNCTKVMLQGLDNSSIVKFRTVFLYGITCVISYSLFRREMVQRKMVQNNLMQREDST